MDIFAHDSFFYSLRRMHSWRNRLSRRWYNLKYGLGNLWRWHSIIWRDRDWDYTPLLAILEFKFRNMADLHEKHGHTVNAHRYARQLRICAELAKRIADDDYESIPIERHEQKWGEPETHFVPSTHGTHQMLTFHNHVKSPADAQHEKEELRAIFYHAQARRHYDLQYMTKMMRKFLLHWWD